MDTPDLPAAPRAMTADEAAEAKGALAESAGHPDLLRFRDLEVVDTTVGRIGAGTAGTWLLLAGLFSLARFPETALLEVAVGVMLLARAARGRAARGRARVLAPLLVCLWCGASATQALHAGALGAALFPGAIAAWAGLQTRRAWALAQREDEDADQPMTRALEEVGVAQALAEQGVVATSPGHRMIRGALGIFSLAAAIPPVATVVFGGTLNPIASFFLGILGVTYLWEAASGAAARVQVRIDDD